VHNDVVSVPRCVTVVAIDLGVERHGSSMTGDVACVTGLSLPCRKLLSVQDSYGLSFSAPMHSSLPYSK
jgi:hypothetical protein